MSCQWSRFTTFKDPNLHVSIRSVYLVGKTTPDNDRFMKALVSELRSGLSVRGISVETYHLNSEATELLNDRISEFFPDVVIRVIEGMQQVSTEPGSDVNNFIQIQINEYPAGPIIWIGTLDLAHRNVPAMDGEALGTSVTNKIIRALEKDKLIPRFLSKGRSTTSL